MERKRRIRENTEEVYKIVFPNLYSSTPNCIMYKETDVDKIRLVAGCRAISFEEKAIKKKKES